MVAIGHARRFGSRMPTPDAPSAGGDVFVLSGGAARGAVQVGMLAGLMDAGIRPAGLVGCSVGALNACFVASHRLAGLVREGSAVERLEDLSVPVRVTTTHLASGRAVYHGTGRLEQLLLASAAVPAIFDPVLLHDHAAGQPSPHVDGGVADRVPVQGVLELRGDLRAPLRR